eukprot:scaffold6241_cov129-Cylindrotheca_fusiformis.AAC.4
MDSIKSKLKEYRMEIASSFSDSGSFQSSWKRGLSRKKKSLDRIVNIVLCNRAMPMDEEADVLSGTPTVGAPDESDSLPFIIDEPSAFATVPSDLTDMEEEENFTSLSDAINYDWIQYR